MSRAEERALEAYPDSTRDKLGILTFWGYSQRYRDCFIDGYEQAEKDILAIIESRISEIIGDAQPRPALRAELEELIKRIKE